jgi:hypothetical protein
MKILKTTTILFLVAIILGGCSHSTARYYPIVEGPMDERYFADLAKCEAFAEERRYQNADVGKTPLGGSGIGGISDGPEDAITDGTGAGVTWGLGTRGTRDLRNEMYEREMYKSVVCGCMKLRGYKMVEND